MIQYTSGFNQRQLVSPGTLAAYDDAVEVIVCGQEPVAMGTRAVSITFDVGHVSVNTCRSSAAVSAIWRPV